MAIEEDNLYSGEKIHRVKRSQELSPEILKIQVRKNSKRGIYSPLLIFYGLIFLIILGTIGLSLPFSKSGLVEYSFVDYIFSPVFSRINQGKSSLYPANSIV